MEQNPPQPPAYAEGSNFDAWTEKLEAYFDTYAVKPAKQVNVLICALPDQTHELLRNLVSPTKPNDMELAELMGTLRQHFHPKLLMIAERFRFNQRDQKEGETIATFVAELKRLAITCEFQDIKGAIRDRLVFGVKNDQIQKRLLSEKDLDLEKAVSLATTMESADARGNEIKAIKSGQGTFTNFMKQKVKGAPPKATPVRYQKPKTQSTVKLGPCRHCGQIHHSDSCRFKNVTCHKCGRPGHIQKVCRSTYAPSYQGTRRNAPKTNYVEEANQEHPSFPYEPNYYNQLNHVKTTRTSTATIPAYTIEPLLNGTKHNMEVDSETNWTLLSEAAWKTIGSPPLSHTNVGLQAWSNRTIKSIGQCEVTVQYRGKTVSLPFIVARGHGPSLFGRQWLRAFGLEAPFRSVLRKSSETVSCFYNQDNNPVRLECLFQRFRDVFEGPAVGVPNYKVRLHMDKDAIPKFHRARPVPYALRPLIDEALDKLEKEGFVSKTEFSDWAAPIVPVRKPNGTIRICGDFKVTINPYLRYDPYPLPKADDLFSKLRRGQLFTKLDLRDAYQQLVLDDESKRLTTINTHRGLYHYNRMCFGITPAASIFQQFMDQILRGIPNVVTEIDDILITGANTTEHLETLEQVLAILSKHHLRLNKAKCSFLQPSVVYLGHKIDTSGIHPLPEKVEAIKQAPLPSNVSELKPFLGLVQYYAKFVDGVTVMCAPLHRLLQKGTVWHMGPHEKAAIQALKNAITTDKVLAHYDDTLPLRLSCDASSYGIGAVISHTYSDGTEKPIQFASRSISKSERNYAQIDKEALSIIFGVQKFRQYLLGRKFTLVTDHQPLVKIFGPKTGTPPLAANRLQRYAIILSSFDYDIVYKVTSEHENSDALSRLSFGPPEPDPDESTIVNNIQISAQPCTPEELEFHTHTDNIPSEVLRNCLDGWKTQKPKNIKVQPYFIRRNELAVEMGIILWGHRVVIPESLRSKVLDQLHEAHQGVVKMKSLARRHCWWPGIDQDIEDRVSNCPGCRENRNMPKVTQGFALPSITEPWERLHIDFAGPFLGHLFLVIVNAHSKYPETFIMTRTDTGATIRRLREVFARHGIPKQIVSDNGPQFVGHEFREFLTSNGVSHILSPPYHPSSNGEAERFVQTMKKGLLRARTNHQNAEDNLQRLLMIYRTTPHTTTNKSPAEVLFCRRPRTRLDLLKPRQTTETMGCTNRYRQFHPGQNVYFRNYRGPPKWVLGTITKRLSNVVYEVAQDRLKHKRHVDQISGVASLTSPNVNGTSEWMSSTTQTNITNREPIPLQRQRQMIIPPQEARDESPRSRNHPALRNEKTRTKKRTQ